MVTVEADEVGVERALAGGRLVCPVCGGVLTGWGHGQERTVRGASGSTRLRPRRSRCTGCERTHVLLPVVLLLRRADAVAVVGAALVAKARGLGHRPIAAELGRPAETVRGWLRRFAVRAEGVRVVFTRLLCDLDADPAVPGAAPSVFADAVAVISEVFTAAVGRFATFTVSAWELAAAVSGGRLLAPGWPPVSINTS